MMADMELLLTQLHNMIGSKVSFHGTTYSVIEVIDDIPAIIIQTGTPASSIQADVHGRARKHSREVVTLMVLNDDKTDFNTDFTELNIL